MSQRPYRVLYMDDDTSCAKIVIKTLQGAGYETEWAQDGKEGLKRLSQNTYDLLAVDQLMPKMSGLEVVREIVGRGPHPPIILITGTGCEALAVEALKLGVKDYVIKDVEGGFLRLLPSVVERVTSEQALIREKEAAIEALRRSEERYRVLVDRSPDAILVFCGGAVVFANPSAVCLLGAQDQNSLLGRKADELWPAVAVGTHPSVQLIQAGTAAGLPDDVTEDQLLRLDGEHIEVEVAMVPVLHDNREAVQLIARDITRRKAAEDGLRRAKDELEQRVADRTKQLRELNLKLQEKVVELETFHDVTVGREHKMMSLERELLRLKEEVAALRGAHRATG
jgi:PAS domain S-box-containing protein